MTTFLDIFNRVYRKLGEIELPNSATQITEQYEKLIADIINDVKEEVEDAHPWRALRQVVTTTVLAGEQSGNIAEANERTRLVRIFQQNNARIIPLVFDITGGVNDPDALLEMDLAELLYRDQIDPDIRQEPTHFALDNSSGNSLDVYVWPRPPDNRTIKLTLTIPQSRIGDDEITEVIRIPTRPIFVGAVWHAMEEKGEELGPDGIFNEARWREAISTAIARDDAEAGNVTELVVT